MRSDLRIARLEGQRDAALMNAHELAQCVRLLLTVLDEGYTLRPDERKHVERVLKQPRARSRTKETTKP